MVSLVEGQIFRRREGTAGGEDPLDNGVGGQIAEHDHPLEGAGLLKAAAEKFGGVILHAHGGKDDGEVALLAHSGLAHDLGGQLVVLHA